MFDDLLNGNFMPHGYCLQWRGDLLFLTVVGDSLTVLAYSLIPLALIFIVKKRDDLHFDNIFILFAAFIFFCGLTHAISILNIWHGFYYIAAIAKFLTGIISVAATVALWRLLPRILAIPSAAELREQNEKLHIAQGELRLANATLEEKVRLRTEALQHLAYTDQLTQVSNRGAILEKLEDEFKRMARHPSKLSLLMLDIDNFKEVNDTLGHLEGDDVLNKIANIIKETCRQTDSVGRYGGEEFLIILPETGLTEGTQLAERIRVAVSQCRTTNGKRVTCSIGVSTLKDNDSMLELIKRADDRVYQAKHHGRNQVASKDDN